MVAIEPRPAGVSTGMVVAAPVGDGLASAAGTGEAPDVAATDGVAGTVGVALVPLLAQADSSATAATRWTPKSRQAIFLTRLRAGAGTQQRVSRRPFVASGVRVVLRKRARELLRVHRREGRDRRVLAWPTPRTGGSDDGG